MSNRQILEAAERIQALDMKKRALEIIVANFSKVGIPQHLCLSSFFDAVKSPLCNTIQPYLLHSVWFSGFLSCAAMPEHELAICSMSVYLSVCPSVCLSVTSWY